MSHQASLTDIQQNYLGKVIGDGQCVAFVRKAASIGATPHWKRGAKIVGDRSIPAGTAIATFDPSGLYGNHTDGRSHAAIYVSQSLAGIVVYDQWLGQPPHPPVPVHERVIRFLNGGPGNPVNDGDQFYVID
jgi:hypothetical protein